MTTNQQDAMRSEMTKDDAVKAVSEFAGRVLCWEISSEHFDHSGLRADPDKVVIEMMIEGRFHSADAFFEGMRVLGGHKLPAKDSHE